MRVYRSDTQEGVPDRTENQTQNLGGVLGVITGRLTQNVGGFLE